MSAGRPGDRFWPAAPFVLLGVAIFTRRVARLWRRVRFSRCCSVRARRVGSRRGADARAEPRALVGDSVPREPRARMGLLGTMSAVGTAFGPALGGLVATPRLARAVPRERAGRPMNPRSPRRTLPAVSTARARAPRDSRAPGSILRNGAALRHLAAYALSMTLERSGAGALRLALLRRRTRGRGAVAITVEKAACPRCLVRVAQVLRPRPERAGLIPARLSRP